MRDPGQEYGAEKRFWVDYYHQTEGKLTPLSQYLLCVGGTLSIILLAFIGWNFWISRGWYHIF